MDQDEFRQTYNEVNSCYCAFEKSVLMNQCQCSLSHKFCIAEREGIKCLSEKAQENCIQILDTIRTQSRFALANNISNNLNKKTLPHGKAIRIQVGGMRGLYIFFNPKEALPKVIPDVSTLVSLAFKKSADLTALPYSLIMQYIAAYQMKKRSKRNHNPKE